MIPSTVHGASTLARQCFKHRMQISGEQDIPFSWGLYFSQEGVSGKCSQEHPDAGKGKQMIEEESVLDGVV